jgi:DNA recombination protein RmuC
LQSTLQSFGDSLQTRVTEIATLQKNQLELFANQLAGTTNRSEIKLTQIRETVENRLTSLSESNAKAMETLRGLVDQKLKEIQDNNGRQLEQMRATVDEKLQGTLEKRLGESFKQVSDRLEQVHKGLGEMQVLATGVGDLKRVLTNVKTRGGWGEIQLESLLEQILSPEQYAKNVKVKPNSSEVVEFAIKLPGKNGSNDSVWIPIDAKFPIEDYHRLTEAQEKADPEAAEAAAKILTTRIKECAKTICRKYISVPYTTDFGIMFLPTEGLYAEVVRRFEVVEVIQRECRVIIAGPTTLAALLNSLQMGFKTLAIEKRSSEVWNLLSVVKKEFGTFGGILEGVKNKLDQASKNMDDAAKKSRTIERKLRDVQTLPAAEAENLLLIAEPEVERDDTVGGATQI